MLGTSGGGGSTAFQVIPGGSSGVKGSTSATITQAGTSATRAASQAAGAAGNGKFANGAGQPSSHLNQLIAACQGGSLGACRDAVNVARNEGLVKGPDMGESLRQLAMVPLMVGGGGEADLSLLTVEQLKAMIGPSQVQLLKSLFGTGRPGAEAALKSLPNIEGLTSDAIAAYRQLALRIIAKYRQTGNAEGVAIQEMRLRILDIISK